MRKIKYTRRLFSKLSSFAIFGIGSLVLALCVFPILHLLSGFSSVRFRRLARKFIQKSFAVFLKYMEISGCIKLSVKNRELLKGVKSSIIFANHPSLIDIVILISLVPNADCIVKGSLVDNKFISAIIRNLYIPNTKPFNEQLDIAERSMKEGNNLIIFPEGTRSKPDSPWIFKKGAARFALFAKADCIPIFYGGNEKIGFRKVDSVWSIHPTEVLDYRLKVLPKISVVPYLDMSMSIGAIRLTNAMRESLQTQIT